MSRLLRCAVFAPLMLSQVFCHDDAAAFCIGKGSESMLAHSANEPFTAPLINVERFVFKRIPASINDDVLAAKRIFLVDLPANAENEQIEQIIGGSIEKEIPTERGSSERLLFASVQQDPALVVLGVEGYRKIDLWKRMLSLLCVDAAAIIVKETRDSEAQRQTLIAQYGEAFGDVPPERRYVVLGTQMNDLAFAAREFASREGTSVVVETAPTGSNFAVVSFATEAGPARLLLLPPAYGDLIRDQLIATRRNQVHHLVFLSQAGAITRPARGQFLHFPNAVEEKGDVIKFSPSPFGEQLSEAFANNVAAAGTSIVASSPLEQTQDWLDKQKNKGTTSVDPSVGFVLRYSRAAEVTPIQILTEIVGDKAATSLLRDQAFRRDLHLDLFGNSLRLWGANGF